MATRRRRVTEKDRKALALWRGGGSFEAIAEALGYRSAEAALGGAQRALESEPVPDLEAQWHIEVIRLDRLAASLWGAASKGDAEAIDRLLKISEVRSKLRRPGKPDNISLLEAFEETVEACGVDARDSALIAGGKKIAHRIDQATQTSTGEEVTKALYLLPHLNKILESMLATPLSRREFEQLAKGSSVGAEVDELAKHREKIRSRRGA